MRQDADRDISSSSASVRLTEDGEKDGHCPETQTTMPAIEDQIVALYARGMTTRDIQVQLTDLYGIDVSPTLVSTSRTSCCRSSRNGSNGRSRPFTRSSF